MQASASTAVPATTATITTSTNSSTTSSNINNPHTADDYKKAILAKPLTAHQEVIQLYEQATAAGHQFTGDAKFEKHVGSAYIYKGKNHYNAKEYQQALTSFEKAGTLLGNDNRVVQTWIQRTLEANPNLQFMTPANPSAAEPPRATM